MPTITGISGENELTMMERRLTVTNGLLGFENHNVFKLTAYAPQTPFYWLISEDDESVSFVVMEPKYIVEDYEFELSEEDVTELTLQAADDAFVLVILCIPEDPMKMTANLLGPLVFNRNSNLGKQIILKPTHYPVQFPLFPEGLPQKQSTKNKEQ